MREKKLANGEARGTDYLKLFFERRKDQLQSHANVQAFDLLQRAKGRPSQTRGEEREKERKKKRETVESRLPLYLLVCEETTAHNKKEE